MCYTPYVVAYRMRCTCMHTPAMHSIANMAARNAPTDTPTTVPRFQRGGAGGPARCGGGGEMRCGGGGEMRRNE